MAAQRPESKASVLRALVSDPQVTSVNRLPMRSSGYLSDSIEAAQAEQSELPGSAPDVRSPWQISLDGLWKFQLLGRPDDLTAELLTGSCSASAWNSIRVPGAWTLQGANSKIGDGRNAFEAPHYTNVIMPFDADPPEVPASNPTGVYRRTVAIPQEWAGRRIVLRVGAAESALQVFVNGESVGGGTDSRLPSEFDLTPFLRPGRNFKLALVVAKWSAQTWLEDQDQWWHGGIQRSVSLYSTPLNHLQQVKLLGGLQPVAKLKAKSGSDKAELPAARQLRVGTLQAEIVVAGPATREPGWTVELRVEELGGSAKIRATTSALALPVWDSSNEVAQLIGGMFVEPGLLRCELDVPKVRAWSHESPQLYRVLTLLRDPSGELVQVQTAKLGFRTVEVAHNELLINGQPVLLHGVNLHEHDPDRGRAVSAELTRSDLYMMKAHNLNAVRAAHYPHDEHLAELCDELGMYLVDEANVESHARQRSLCHDPRFSHSILERVQRMAQRDVHHPSIILWSLGNESGDGAVHQAAAAWLRSYDPTRPVQYEGSVMHDLFAEAPATDIVCPMYSSIDEILAWAAAGRDSRRPLILCEYSHAMGNSNGSLADYWDAFESTHGLQGGFIWEWLDHGLRRTDSNGVTLIGPDGSVSWGYGGDFGDSPTDNNFICDGLVSADRIAHPVMTEVRHVGRPVKAAWTAGGQGSAVDSLRVEITNCRWFSGLEILQVRWELLADGELVAAGPIALPKIGPRESREVLVPVSAALTQSLPKGVELHLNLIGTLVRKSPWSARGHEVARDQLTLTQQSHPKFQPRAAVVPISARPKTKSSPAPLFQVDPAGTADFRIARIEWKPTVFRALTDNDGLRQGWMSGLVGGLARWVNEQGVDACEWVPTPEVERQVGDAIVIRSGGALSAPGVTDAVQVTRRARIQPDGWTQLLIEMKVPPAMSDPLRVGVELLLPASLSTPSSSDRLPGSQKDAIFEHLEWCGLGPGENYSDRCASVTVGRWNSTVTAQYEDYAVPQEHGHKEGLRWLSLSSQSKRNGSACPAGTGLLIVTEPQRVPGSSKLLWPGFAARHHSDAELWASLHTDQLTSGQSRPTFVYLDAAQRGLGTASCGPDTRSKYQLAAGRYRVSVWCRYFDAAKEDPSLLARSLRAASI
ncbi:MAG: glycoside hydrolase family 2 TIM barrel-domain containing protein [Microthrixaceae bacterium]